MAIKAYHRREERYEGLQLVYGEDEAAKAQILEAIEAVKAESEIAPKVMENCDLRERHKCAIYMEFDDDYDREGGAFFERVLERLNIKKCD
ncbi:MAG: hypothetical protein LBU73_04290 [Helicobacteraceae bacterium]|jgi:Fe-S-cluster formation regulator IscX/YfhJ|nr:hypothetical protein [Helicobacteraceae bacterium]